MAAVVEDLVDEETTDILRSTTAGLVRHDRHAGARFAVVVRDAEEPDPPGTDRGRRPDRATRSSAIVIAALFDLGIGLLALGAGIAGRGRPDPATTIRRVLTTAATPPELASERSHDLVVEEAVGRQRGPAVDRSARRRGRSPGRPPPRRRSTARRGPSSSGRPRPSPRRRPRRRARSPRSRRSRARATPTGAGRRSPAPPRTPRCRAATTVQDLGIGERADPRDTDPARRPAAGHRADRPRAATAPRLPALAERRRAHDAGLELAVALDREQRPEQRHAAHEVVGAVDRVDVPADGARRRPPCRIPRRRGRGPGTRAAIRSRISRSIAVSAWVTNVRSGLVSMTRSRRKCSSAMRVGLVAAGQREREPGVVARRRVLRVVGHARILAPSGSYSGSRATSKPTHSPKTSTSPRVPIAARSGGR